jgi:DNA-binding CsgD family transcriptional regulator
MAVDRVTPSMATLVRDLVLGRWPCAVGVIVPSLRHADEEAARGYGASWLAEAGDPLNQPIAQLVGQTRIWREVRRRVESRGAKGPCGPSERGRLPRIEAVARRWDLGSRDASVLAHVVGGRSNKEIGISLDLDEAKVKHVLQRLFAAAGVRNRASLAVAAMTASKTRRRAGGRR